MVVALHCLRHISIHAYVDAMSVILSNIPKMPPPIMMACTFDANHPIGAPSKTEDKRDISSLSSVLSLLAGNPFIAMFANDTWNSSIDELKPFAKNEDPDGNEYMDTDSYLLGQLLVGCIYNINHGSAEVLNNCMQSLAERAHSPRAVVVVNMYSNYHDLLIRLMEQWWKPYLYQLYLNYGFKIGISRTITSQSTRISSSVGSDISHSIVIDVSNYKRSFVDLEYEITHNVFNCAKRNPDGSDEPHSSITEIDVLPFRFTVAVKRHAAREVNVVYRPRTLVIGPTKKTNEWANYRLVGRITRNGPLNRHTYTSSVLSTADRCKPFNDDIDVLKSAPTMTSFNGAIAQQAAIESTLGVCEDANSVLLEFERHE